MLTVVGAVTALVLTVNVALVAAAAIVTLEGTVATDVSLLESATCVPPDGAGPLSVTVPLDELPPITLVGIRVSEVSISDVGSTGCTVAQAVLVTPSLDDALPILVGAVTALVLTVNVALVDPAAIVTLEGTVATDVSLLESVACAPPDGAGPLRVTVPVEESPPVT